MMDGHEPGTRTLDVSGLPPYAFGPQGLIWWGTVGYMVIEGSMFVIVLVVYFYLRLKVDAWPPSLPDPDPLYGTINLALMGISLLPNWLTKRAAERLDRGAAKLWMVVMVIFGVLPLVIRFYEYFALNCRWDSNAYGSIVWLILSMHTLHLATDLGDTVVLSALTFSSKWEEKRFVDISENALYWYFVVFSWVPLYLVIYFAPRWM
jgi:heme/copper-type cytochrome/quinol oxidase subunit 3